MCKMVENNWLCYECHACGCMADIRVRSTALPNPLNCVQCGGEMEFTAWWPERTSGHGSHADGTTEFTGPEMGVLHTLLLSTDDDSQTRQRCVTGLSDEMRCQLRNKLGSDVWRQLRLPE